MHVAAPGARHPRGALICALVLTATIALTAAPDRASAAEPTAVAAATETTATESTGAATAPPGETRIGRVTKQPMPRYVSLRSNEINVRRGPGLKYRKDWVFRRAGLPVRVIDEYGDWRRIVDSDNAGGWVYHALLSGRRTVLVTGGETAFRARPKPDARITARAEEGVVGRLLECRPAWCEVDLGDAAGWVPKTALWGVGESEIWPD